MFGDAVEAFEVSAEQPLMGGPGPLGHPLELAGMLPGSATERAERYERALRTAGRGVFG